MGLEQGSNIIYLQTLEGELKRSVKKDTEGATMRENKEGNTVYELYYRALSGVLKRIWVEDGKYAKELKVLIEDEEQLYNLQLSWSGSYAEGLLRRIEDIDLAKRIRIVVGARDEKYYLVVYQKKGDKQEMIPARYTKEDPGECPAFEKIMVDGEEKWDKSKRLDFYLNIVVNKISPELERLYPDVSTPERQTEQSSKEDKTVEQLPDDDQVFRNDTAEPDDPF